MTNGATHTGYFIKDGMMEIDYRELLKKYMIVVGNQEGTDFIDYCDTEAGFSEDEIKALEVLHFEKGGI